MSVPQIGHERQLTFFPANGHNHDGENSSPVELQPGQVGLKHLDPALLEWIRDATGDDQTIDNGGLLAVPDLQIETNSVGAGASVTGSIDWVGIAVVRYVRVMMSVESECTITFYHRATYADEDREFRAQRCSNKFLWEGPWVHWDEDQVNKIHYKITNTGNSATRFNLMLKAGTLVANTYANYVSGVRNMGDGSDALRDEVRIRAGNGIIIETDEDSNSFVFSAGSPETMTIERMALIMRMPTGYVGSTTTSGGPLQSNFHSTTNVNFGNGPQWIRMDYGRLINVGRIVIVPYPDGRQWYDTKVDVSADGQNWITLMSQQSLPLMVGQGGLFLEIPTGLNIRYVRWHSNGSSTNTTNHLVAAVVYEISDKVGTI